MHTEKATAVSTQDAGLVIGPGRGAHEVAEAHGRFVCQCFDKDGNLKWEDTIENVVCTEGKNVALDAFLAGSSYTVVGPYMGLISSTSYTAVAAGDTAAQINGTNGGKEAGNANTPTYTSPRKNGGGA